MHPLLTRWRISQGEIPGTKGKPMLPRISVPLIFEPGTSFQYGHGIDWASVLVARLNGCTLEAYMQTHVFAPLGIVNIAFHLEKAPAVKEKLVTMRKRRNSNGEPPSLVAVATSATVEWSDETLYDDPIVEDYGGHGGFGSPLEYMKITRSLLAGDGLLLSPASVDELFRPQLFGTVLKSFEAFRNAPMWANTFGSHPAGTKVNHGLGGMLVLDDMSTGLRGGTMLWSGLPNMLWLVDREMGVGMFYATNILPYGDFKSHEFEQLFERAVYESIGGKVDKEMEKGKDKVGGEGGLGVSSRMA